MKVTHNTPERLTLDDRPWIVGVLLIGFTLIFLAVGINLLLNAEVFGGLMMGGVGGGLGFLAFWGFVRRTIVFLDRAAGVVLIREASLFGQTETTYPLASVRRARVESSRSGQGSSTHRPALEMGDGSRLPLRKAYISGQGAGRVVAALNDWLDRPGAA